jgi:hypothetical protein
MKELKEIIKMLLNEIEKKENILNISGGKGYGVGKARVKDPHPVSRNLGVVEEIEEEEYVLKPVKISKAFKGK